MTIKTIIEDMQKCYQTPTQNVLEHGVSVNRCFNILIDHLKNDGEIPNWWRIPEWCYDKRILSKLLPSDILCEYATYHDCGKTVTKMIDENGKQHFPGHAKASEDLWRSAGGKKEAAILMGMDMDIHLIKADGLEEFANRPQAISLLLMALAEVHSNAALFGGENSDSFKIKAKHLDKRGKQIWKLITDKEMANV